MTFIQGIDVSKWQATTPDLTGCEFLIARAGIGTGLDPMYKTHIANARKAGIATGSYWYNIGTLSPSDEVNAYIAAEGNVDLHVLDWEGTDGFTAAQAREFISLYKQRTGNRIALYASESRFTDLGQDWNWIANYSQEPSKHYDIWQYGPFHGADGDRLQGSLSALIGDTMTAAAITDETPKTVTVAAGPWYALDGKTVLTTGGALTARVSPYEAGALRAIFATVAGVRQAVLVKAATVADIPPTVVIDRVDASAEQIASAVAAKAAADASIQTTAVSAATKAEHDRIAAKLGHLAD